MTKESTIVALVALVSIAMIGLHVEDTGMVQAQYDQTGNPWYAAYGGHPMRAGPPQHTTQEFVYPESSIRTNTHTRDVPHSDLTQVPKSGSGAYTSRAAANTAQTNHRG